MVQNFPASVVKLWNEWNVRVMVMTSLCLQIVLIVFGNRRKYIARNWIGIVTWMAYLSADWVATVALGMISNFQGVDDDQQNTPHPNTLIMASWAPFLLVHLGGPDTITAYSAEDNELWLRHLISLIVQVGVALYILVRTASTYHMLLVVPVLVAGIIKYGERTWVLRSASSKKLSDSLLPPPNPGNGYADLAEKYSAAKARGQGVGFFTTGTEGCTFFQVNPVIPEARPLHEAFGLFKIFRRLYANLILDYHELQHCYDIMERVHSAEDVFKQVETELGLMYDVLYTKASVVYSLKGVIFRSISLLCYISTFVIFCFAIDKKLYSTIDITLTYLLSLGAIVLELYAIMILVSTDWSLYWLSKQKHPLAYHIYQAISRVRSNYLSNGKRWSESMEQFNLIDFCLKEKPPKCAGIQRVLGIYEMAEKYWYTTSKDVPIKMKQLIFKKLTDTENGEEEDRKVFLKWRGNHALQKQGCMDKFSWSVVEATFDKSILLWHIATDLCFYSDLDRYNHQAYPNSESKLTISKLLSEYMMYILVMRHFMLPKGIGKIRFRDTCAEATNFFQKRRDIITNGRSHARQALLGVNTELDPEAIIGDRSKTVLFEGCRLAKQLKSLETELEWTNEDKWELISQVWIEMLCYAASQCGWKEHGQQLRRGGELLTHVCLLMANLGLSEQFQIKRGTPTVGIFTP